MKKIIFYIVWCTGLLLCGINANAKAKPFEYRYDYSAGTIDSKFTVKYIAADKTQKAFMTTMNKLLRDNKELKQMRTTQGNAEKIEAITAEIVKMGLNISEQWDENKRTYSMYSRMMIDTAVIRGRIVEIFNDPQQLEEVEASHRRAIEIATAFDRLRQEALNEKTQAAQEAYQKFALRLAVDEYWLMAVAETQSATSDYNTICRLCDTIINLIDTVDKKLYINANLLLAAAHGRENELIKMDQVIGSLTRYVEENPDDTETVAELDGLITYKNEIIKRNANFFDEICGIWVSDYSTDANKIPYLVLSIAKDSIEGKYKTTIEPYCTIYKSIKSLEATEGQNIRVFNEKEAYDEKQFDVYPDDRAELYFGKKEFKYGQPFMAQFVADFVADFSNSLIKGLKYMSLSSSGKVNWGAEFGIMGVQIGMVGATMLIHELTVKKTYTTTFNMLIERRFSGCTDITVIENQLYDRSDGGHKESHTTKKFMMFKLHPEYDVIFASDLLSSAYKSNSINEDKQANGIGIAAFLLSSAYKSKENGIIAFGGKKLNVEEIAGLNLTSKNIDSINTLAYKQLKEKTINLYNSISKDNENDSRVTLIELENRFQYSAKGLFYGEIKKYDDGTYSGFFNVHNADSTRHGWGYYEWNDGTAYDGEWANNKRNGTGYVEYADGSMYNGEWTKDYRDGQGYFKSDSMEYTGEWKNGKMYKGLAIYASGTKQDGTWSGKKFTGKITYADGNIFEGDARDNKSKGKLSYPNGDTFTGQQAVVKKINTRKGIYTYANGDRYEGAQIQKEENGKWLKDGKGKITIGNEIVTGIWKDDELVKEQKRTVNKTK
jgi:hypothetical protein